MIHAFDRWKAQAADNPDKLNQQLISIIFVVIMSVTLIVQLILQLFTLPSLWLVIALGAMLSALGLTAIFSHLLLAPLIKAMGEIHSQSNQLAEGSTERDNLKKELEETSKKVDDTVLELEKAHSIKEVGERELKVTEGRLVEVNQQLELASGNFINLVGQLKSMSLEISTQSDEIVAIVKSQGQGMGKTAASLQDFTATLEQLAKSSVQIASLSGEIAQVSSDTYDLANQAAKTLNISQQALQNIQKSSSSITQRILDLNEKSKEIGVILDIIESIADKTDILALNAALEGTKAGEAGRGFSLVAKEMRRLSERVTESTAKIKEVIRDIQTAISSSVIATEDGVKTTQSGIEVIEKTAHEFEDIFKMVEKIKNASSQISLGTNQQKSATEQSVASMNEISEVVMQNAMGVREINLALAELNKIAGDLKDQIDTVDLSDLRDQIVEDLG